MKGPQFLKYMIPLIDTLKEIGGMGNKSDVVDKVIENMNIPDDEVEKQIQSGYSRVRNRISWARFYLYKAEYIDSPERGKWRLTEKGFKSSLKKEDLIPLFKEVQEGFKNEKKGNKKPKIDDENLVIDENESTELLDILKSNSAEGFERICKRLLTEIGIKDITITGRSGDQGIDGIGIIKLNDVVNFNIVFQCKRYKETVGPHFVRDFRGAMQGRAEKGLFISTGRFTLEAKKEANRDGVPPIELIDGERLVGLFEKYELGVKPKIVYEIDHDFFENFK